MAEKEKKEETFTPEPGADKEDQEIIKEIKIEKGEKPSKEPEEVKEEAGLEGFVEIDGVKYKADPESPEEPLKDEKGELIPFEEKKEPETPEGAVEIDGVFYKEDSEKLGEALTDKKGELVPFKKPKRTPRLVPIYKLKIAEKKWKKEQEGLQKTIDDLNVKLKERPDLDRDAKIEAYAKEHGMDSAVLKGLIKLVTPKGMIISDELRGDIIKLKKDLAWKKEFDQFDKDYAKNIPPLLKTEKVPQESWEEIKELLKSKAFTTEYVNTPLAVIYRGDTDFDKYRGAPKGKKTAEPGGKGPRGKEPAPGKKDVIGMGDKEFDEFDKELEKESKKEGLEIRRGGRSTVV